MRAVVITKYGLPAEVLRIQEVARPTPADHQVLVRVRAGSINVSDVAPIRGALLARLLGAGWRKPKRAIMGADLAGQVEAVGKTVTRFKPGDDVFGTAPGSLAEYACAAEDRLALKPADVTFETAAAVPVAGISALQGLRHGRIAPGQKVLIHGASGGVGTLAVQLAKAFEAEVTAVCSPRNLDNARRLGADHVIDYTQEDFTHHRGRYDLILAVNGNRAPWEYRKALSGKGRCVVLGGSMAQITQALVLGRALSEAGGRTIDFMGIAKLNQADLESLRALLAAGALQPLIEKSYPLGQTAEAVTYLAQGHAQAKVVITLP